MTSALGLTWYSQWASKGEGPYTLIAKLAAANPISSGSMRSLLINNSLRPRYLGVAERNSLLDGGWMRRSSPTCEWAATLADSTLSSLIGNFTFLLASDKNFRYCPLCLEAGFQSSVCQIDALQYCPVHLQELRWRCHYCNAPTPAYAWNSDFDTPMSCSHCVMPFSSAWGAARLLQWQGMKHSEMYCDLQLKLASIFYASWTDAQGWIKRFPGREHSAECRRVEGALLTHALGIQSLIPHDKAWAAPPEYMKLPLNSEASAIITHNMRLIYDSYCKKYAPSQITDILSESIKHQRTFNRLAFKSSGLRDAVSTAYVLFRRRFEEDGPRQGEHPLTKKFLSEPMKGLIFTFSSDSEAWSNFLEMCYRADLRYSELLAECSDGLNPHTRPWEQAIEKYAAALNCFLFPLPYGMGIVKLSSEQHSTALIAFAD